MIATPGEGGQNPAYRPIPKPEWVIPPPPEPGKVQALVDSLALPGLAARLLVARGHSTTREAQNFLNPSLSQLHDPKELPDMERAVELICEVIAAGGRIRVYGDYDTDGVCATALLYRILRGLGAQVDYYIPNRLTEGYGLSELGVRDAAQNRIDLLITVDCGTTDAEEIQMARSSGMKVVVCDHHEVQRFNGLADGFINPRRPDSRYPFDDLAGVGVAFKLGEAILSRLGESPQIIYEWLDLVALGTVADVAPLTGENRVLVIEGLKRIGSTKSLGLSALLKIAGLEAKEISPYHISFILAPRLNAMGRLGEALSSVELLITQDGEEAEHLARKLNDENQRRQEIEARILSEAESCLLEDPARLSKLRVLVLASDTWHEGVVGIVASRLCERYFRPTILFAPSREGYWKGSGRSVPGFPLYDTLCEHKDLIERFGGHKYAAGLVVRRSKLGELEERLNDYAYKRFPEEIFKPRLFVDGVASLYEIDEQLLHILKRFEPFGPGNPAPVFASLGLEVVGCPSAVGPSEGSHLKFRVRERKDRVLSAIAFGAGAEITRLVVGGEDQLDIAYHLSEDDYTGKPRLELKVKDIRFKTAPPNSK